MKNCLLILSALLLLSGCGESDTANKTLDKDIQKLQAQLDNKQPEERTLLDHIVEVFNLDKRLVLLETSGLIEKRISAKEMMAKYVEAKLVDLNSGKFIDDPHLLAIYDEQTASEDPSQSTQLSKAQDPAGIERRENIGKLYLIKDDHNRLDKIVIPIRSLSRFSLLYGYLSLDAKSLTITGIGFYQHAETPGLGAEFVYNPKVKKSFIDKKVFKNNQPNFSVIIKHSKLIDDYSIDGVSGATYTSRAVERAINYWCGENGFGPVIQALNQQVLKASI